jgi:catechol 2,3-dioxygenase-like lactoylglutathione lyase family enzyme
MMKNGVRQGNSDKWGKDTMIKLTGIHHLAMATANMDLTIRFWRDLIGLKLVVGLGRSGYKHYFFKISSKTHIAFFEWPEVQPVAEKDHGMPISGPLIFDHVSLGVESEDDLWELKDRVETAGFWVSDVIDHGLIRSIYSFDPNGIPIEFSVCTSSLDLARSPVLVDQFPSETALQGADPVQDVWPSVPYPTLPEERTVFPGEGKDLLESSRMNWWGKKEDKPQQPEESSGHSPSVKADILD